LQVAGVNSFDKRKIFTRLLRFVHPCSRHGADRPPVHGRAALFLLELGTLLRDEALIARDDQSLRALGRRKLDGEGLAVGFAALAAHAAADDLVEVTVVAPATAPRRELIDVARSSATAAGAFVRVEAPGHYPDVGKPSVFVCTDRACSPPLHDSDRIRASVVRALRER
jgi:uncharacterized protein YyaL (SSP411 family)